MVGYQTKSLDVDAGEYLHSVGVNFSCMESETGAYTVSDKLFDRTVDLDDQILVFDPDEYNLEIYEYRGSTRGWSYTSSDQQTSYCVASFTVQPGATVLYMPSNPETDLIVSGEVAASGTQTVTFEVTDDDYLFDFANPYPIDTTVADLNSFCQPDDQILVFDPDEYNLEIYEYRGSTRGWSYTSADQETSYYVTDPETVIVPAGNGAWFMPTDTRTWTVTCNYAD